MSVYDLAELVKLALLASILYVIARDPVDPKLDVDCVNNVVRVTARGPSVKRIDLSELAETCRRGE